MIPKDAQYTLNHLWLRERSAGVFRVGITDFAATNLGDIVAVALPERGEVVHAGHRCGEIESNKSVIELALPSDARILETNVSLAGAPQQINADPYGAGWLFDMEILGADTRGFVSADDYATRFLP